MLPLSQLAGKLVFCGEHRFLSFPFLSVGTETFRFFQLCFKHPIITILNTY